jgi:hypothetical protein
MRNAHAFMRALSCVALARRRGASSIPLGNRDPYREVGPSHGDAKSRLREIKHTVRIRAHDPTAGAASRPRQIGATPNGPPVALGRHDGGLEGDGNGDEHSRDGFSDRITHVDRRGADARRRERAAVDPGITRDIVCSSRSGHRDQNRAGRLEPRGRDCCGFRRILPIQHGSTRRRSSAENDEIRISKPSGGRVRSQGSRDRSGRPAHGSRSRPCPRRRISIVALMRLKESAMTSGNESEVRISNWTLATGTRPGERKP